jgi:hypothetical protein
MTALRQDYGSLENLYHRASGGEDLEKRLKEFKGIGLSTAQIFLRELRGAWHVQPKVAEITHAAAANLNIALDQFEVERIARVETALVKLHLRYCKREKCSQCPMGDSCTEVCARS